MTSMVLGFDFSLCRQTAVVTDIQDDKAPSLKKGDVVVKIDPRYFRPTAVETLLGYPAKAKLGWTPENTVQKMFAEMVTCDLEEAQKHALLKMHGYMPTVTIECLPIGLL